MKKLLQKILSKFGLRLSRIPIYIDPVAPFSLLEMAIKLQLDKEKKEFYFLQIGANDGILADALNPIIRKYRLPGCLVEPMRDVYKDLKMNYVDQKQLDFRNVMVSHKNGIGTMYRFRRDAELPASFYHGLAREDSDYIFKRAKAAGLTHLVESLEVKSETFDTLIDSLAVKHISLLFIDTEGSDDGIIEAAFESGIFPPIINYEWTEMTPQRRYLLKMKLLDHGYRFIDNGADTICMRGVHA
ncbi:MAG: FkbM family methyltransferase [Gammaproteobacteria bacterium]|jgi:FkbM family methyltransferase